MALGRVLRNALLDGPNQTGCYDPKEVMPVIEEHLTGHEYYLAEGFLSWVSKNGLKYGSDTINTRFQEYLAAQ